MIAGNRLEHIALSRMNLEPETIANLKFQHRDNVQMVNFEIFNIWKNKTKGGRQVGVKSTPFPKTSKKTWLLSCHRRKSGFVETGIWKPKITNRQAIQISGVRASGQGFGVLICSVVTFGVPKNALCLQRTKQKIFDFFCKSLKW